jgi:uncharacterized membrane protein YdfJ with MMPL/SSD domain
MARVKKISNTTAILVALGAISGLQISFLLDITDTTPMAIVVLFSIAIGYGFSYLIHQFRKGFREKN